MKTIKIVVRDKIAVTMDETQYICGNSDFVVNFDFDAEWDGFDVKTVRFIKDNRKYIDVVLQGNECPVPVIFNTNKIMVGVFAGDLHTTTPAIIPAQKGILCRDGSPEAPSDDVYAQIMEQLNRLETGKVNPEAIAAAVDEYMKENPVDLLPEDGTAGQVLTKTEDGAVWADIVIPKEYGLITYDQDKTITIT